MSTYNEVTSSEADAAVLCMMIVMAAIYEAGKRMFRRALPRMAGYFRRQVRSLRSLGLSARLRGRAAPVRIGPCPGAARITVPLNRLAVPADPLAIPRGLAPWDRLSPERAAVYVATVQFGQPEPWFSVRETASFPACPAEIGYADTHAMAAVR